MLTGLARDGGLYVPAELPRMSHGDIAALAGLSYEEGRCSASCAPFVGRQFSPIAEFGDCNRARLWRGFGHAGARAPLKQLTGQSISLLELFPRPHARLQEIFAMQLIGQLFRLGPPLRARAER